MAEIPEGTLKQWGDMDRVNATDYLQEREILRLAINDTNEKLTNLQESDPVTRETGDELYAGRKQILEVIETTTDLTKQLAENVYYDEVTYEKYRDSTSSTDYYITHIPHLDGDGELIKLKHGYQNDLMNSGVGETVRSFGNRHATSLAANASIWSTSTGLIKGVQIQEGIIKQDIDGGTSYTLGIKSDNTLVAYPPTTPAATILNDGCINAITGFFPMINNGVAVDPSIYGVIGNPIEPNPRNVIAQLPNKDIIFLSCEGRTTTNLGMTYADMIRILLARGVSLAYCLDGGGSTQTVVRGLQVNNPLDDNGKTERKVADFLYVARSTENDQNFKTISKDMGIVNKKLSDVARDLLTTNTDLLGLNRLPTVAPNIGNLDNITKSNFYWCAGTALNAPSTANSWGVLHFQAGAASALQIAFPYQGTTGSIMLRRTVSDMTTWTAWRAM
ncbi:phosphodiester glycosidase family protein [Peribacillus simplex]|uniref:phosphodiester glycosidase family protein n=1 Tax=Peribacillus simplex TaxID=1478 RepID=UPI003D2D0A33